MGAKGGKKAAGKKAAVPDEGNASSRRK